jgi:hypothetical protein
MVSLRLLLLYLLYPQPSRETTYAIPSVCSLREVNVVKYRIKAINYGNSKLKCSIISKQINPIIKTMIITLNNSET